MFELFPITMIDILNRKFTSPVHWVKRKDRYKTVRKSEGPKTVNKRGEEVKGDPGSLLNMTPGRRLSRNQQ